jgi:hypothetical protein
MLKFEVGEFGNIELIIKTKKKTSEVLKTSEV